MDAFILFNKTDGVFADPRTFPTKEAAEKAGVEFRKRFAIQGYYKTADGRRIDPKDVELEAQPIEDDEVECEAPGVCGSDGLCPSCIESKRR